MIPQETVRKVTDTADIVEVIGEFVSLHKSGSSYKGLCPFHNEKTPSFMVSPSKQIYKCFGCGESGTSVSFLMKHEKFTFTEAIRWLANKYGITIEERELSVEEQIAKKEGESLLALNTFAQNYFTNNLFNSPDGQTIALPYFKQRDLSDQTIKQFQLGYSFDRRDDFVQFAIKNGYKPELLEKGGLAISKTNDNIFTNKTKFFDRFFARVIFPITSLSGQVIAFGGRTLSSDKNIAKYINSPETPVYNKSQSLYGIYFAKNEIVKQDKCYLVEGYLDVISMHQTGVTNTVASSGTSLTEEQIRIIRRFTRNLTLIFDADPAGMKASIRGIDLALKEDMNLRIVTLPKGEDPDTFCRKNQLSEVREYIDTHETDFLLFKMNLVTPEALLDPIKKSALIKDIIETISLIPDNLKRDEYIKLLAEKQKLNIENVYTEINKSIDKNVKSENKQNIQSEDVKEKQTTQIPSFVNQTSLPEEKQLIMFLLKFGDLQYEENQTVAQFIINEIENEGGFRNIIYKQIFEFYKQNFDNYGIKDGKLLMSHENEDIRRLATEIFTNEYQLSKIWSKNGNFVLMPEDTYKSDIKITIIAFKLRILELFLKKINDEINNPELSHEEIEEKLKLSNQVIKARQELMNIGGKRNIY